MIALSAQFEGGVSFAPSGAAGRCASAGAEFGADRASLVWRRNLAEGPRPVGYLYRAIDRDGNLIDAMLSEHRDMRAAKAFFRSARATMGFRPDRVTTDGHGSYPRAIRTVLGRTVRHRTNVSSEQSSRTGSSRHQGQDPMYAGLQEP